jgi:hypothetical protein
MPDRGTYEHKMLSLCNRPALPHKWPPYKERTDESVCLRPGCGECWGYQKYLKQQGQGEEEAAAKV